MTPSIFMYQQPLANGHASWQRLCSDCAMALRKSAQYGEVRIAGVAEPDASCAQCGKKNGGKR